MPPHSSSPAPGSAPLWLRAHQLSLEAPLVAMSWTLALSRLHHVSLMPGVLPGLGLSVWCVYVLDRVLDEEDDLASLREARHAFHRRWRRPLLAGVAASCGLLGWLALTVVPVGLLWQCVGLSILILLYLAVYLSHGRRWYHRLMIPGGSLLALGMVVLLPLPSGFRWITTLLIGGLIILGSSHRLHQHLASGLSKDVAGGLLFALGATTWTRFTQDGGDVVASGLEMLLLGCLFVSNLTGISSRAAQGRWLALGLGLVAGVLGLVAVGRMASSLGHLAEACGLGLLLLLALDGPRKRLSAEAYRVWADLAVWVPALYLWMRA